jgi:glucuronosyltransferase
VSDSPLVFVNVDELVDFPRPIFPHVVYIGGLEFEQSRKKDGAAAAPASKPLDEPFRSQMERGRRGVVFFSLGSAVNTVYLPEQFRRNLFAAIAQLPDWHFLVKVSDDDALSRELASGMANVFLTGWAPQRAILGWQNRS